jgi:hypothetical protein
MPQSINTFGGGGGPTTTRTEINAGPAGPSGFYDASFMNFLRRRPQAQGPMHRAPTTFGGEAGTPNERALDDAKTAAMIAQYRAESERAPMKYVDGGFNMGPPRLEMDTTNFTGAQREKFLPQGAALVPFQNKEPSSLEEDVRSGGQMASNQDVAAQRSNIAGSMGAAAGDDRRQQEIKDQQLRNYYGTKPQQAPQQGKGWGG